MLTMLRPTVCFLILIAFVVADYNFGHSDFNEQLLDDLRIEAEPLRFKRDLGNESEFKEGHGKRLHHCCKDGGPNSEQLKKMRNAWKDCRNEICDKNDDPNFAPLNCGGPKTMKEEQMVCLKECVANKFDLVDENGNLKRNDLLKHAQTLFEGSFWQPEVLEEYVDECLTESKEQTEAGYLEGFKCNPIALEFRFCMWRKIVGGCPSEMQIDSRKCDRIRESLENGEKIYPKMLFNRLRNGQKQA